MCNKQYNRNLNLYSTLIILALNWNSNKNREKNNKKIYFFADHQICMIVFALFPSHTTTSTAKLVCGDGHCQREKQETR